VARRSRAHNAAAAAAPSRPTATLLRLPTPTDTLGTCEQTPWHSSEASRGLPSHTRGLPSHTRGLPSHADAPPAPATEPAPTPAPSSGRSEHPDVQQPLLRGRVAHCKRNWMYAPRVSVYAAKRLTPLSCAPSASEAPASAEERNARQYMMTDLLPVSCRVLVPPPR